jgi:hypothetical protein
MGDDDNAKENMCFYQNLTKTVRTESVRWVAECRASMCEVVACASAAREGKIIEKERTLVLKLASYSI